MAALLGMSAGRRRPSSVSQSVSHLTSPPSRQASSYTVEARAVSDAAHKRGPAERIGPPQNPPQNLELVRLRHGRLDIFWDAPADYDGGPPITGYVVEIQLTARPWHDLVGPGNSGHGRQE